MIHVTCRLTAKNRDQLRNPTLGNRVCAPFFTFRWAALWHCSVCSVVVDWLPWLCAEWSAATYRAWYGVWWTERHADTLPRLTACQAVPHHDAGIGGCELPLVAEWFAVELKWNMAFVDSRLRPLSPLPFSPTFTTPVVEHSNSRFESIWFVTWIDSFCKKISL